MNHPYLYLVWANMKQRCLNPKDPSWIYYGGATPAVKIYPPWLKYENFEADILAEIGHRPPGLNPRTRLSLYQFDRINSFEGYQPGNIRWVTVLENEQNKRPPKQNTRKGRKKGQKETVPEYLVFTNSTAGYIRMSSH